MRYYIADCHFFHLAMNDKMDQRGFESTESMNKFMLKQWNSRVRKNDEVVILGDLSFGKWEQTQTLVERLNGKKYLIAGNHDKYLNNKSFNKELFKKITSYDEMQDNNRKVILCHYPIFCYNGQNRVDDFGNPKVYMLHGHIHNTIDQALVDKFVEETRKTKRIIQGKEQGIPCNIINCFCMKSNYIPLTLDEWIEIENKGLKG
ncbi:metallophosphoesterase [Lacrimispora amygdalina]|uniref:metallophosphoesterase n=1 Tax=Lacrimispora amygdalina TaxID=253257 RepID=UPI000BE3312A|nr:metallophosphoesterase [Lacrimispora amygdalina]